MCLGIPGKIVEISSHSTAVVEIGGAKRTADITCVIPSNHPIESLIDEWVLVHVGFAMSRIDAGEAEATLALLEELGELEEDQALYQESEVNDVKS